MSLSFPSVPPLPSVNIFAFIYLPWHKLDSHHTYRTMTGRSKQTPQSSETTDNHKCTQKAKTKCPAMDDSSREEFSLPVSSSRHSLSETNPHLEEWATLQESKWLKIRLACCSHSHSHNFTHPPLSTPSHCHSQEVRLLSGLNPCSQGKGCQGRWLFLWQRERNAFYLPALQVSFHPSL